MKKFANFSMDVREALVDADKYANFSKLMLDTAHGKVESYSDAEANDKIREIFHSIMGTTKESSKREIRNAMRKHKYDIFEVIEEVVEDKLVSGWGENPFFREFVEMKSAAFGDKNEFVTEDKSVLTVAEISGGHHNIERQALGFGEVFSVKTSWIGLKVYAEYESFMAGRVDWAKMINKITEAVNEYVNATLYKAVMGAGASLPAQEQFNLTGTLTKEKLIQLVDDVQAATGREAVIMGTKAALAKVTALGDVQWISNNMKDEMNKTGRLGLFEGIRLVEIPQAFAPNDTTTKLVDNNKLLIMPVADNKFIKVVYEGDPQIREISNGDTNMDKTVEYEYQYKMGVATVIGYYFGTWTIE